MGSCVSCLDADDYVLLDYPNGKTIEHGPGFKFFCCATANKYKMPRINNDQYIEINHLEPDSATRNLMEIVPGPILYRPTDAYAEISKPKQKIRLGIDDYIVTKS